MNASPSPETHFCPYLERIITLERENEVLQAAVSGNGLTARVDYMETDEFAVSVGNRIAEHVGKEIVKAGVKWALAGILLLSGAAIPGLLKMAGFL